MLNQFDRGILSWTQNIHSIRLSRPIITFSDLPRGIKLIRSPLGVEQCSAVQWEDEDAVVLYGAYVLADDLSSH